MRRSFGRSCSCTKFHRRNGCFVDRKRSRKLLVKTETACCEPSSCIIKFFFPFFLVIVTREILYLLFNDGNNVSFCNFFFFYFFAISFQVKILYYYFYLLRFFFSRFFLFCREVRWIPFFFFCIFPFLLDLVLFSFDFPRRRGGSDRNKKERETERVTSESIST